METLTPTLRYCDDAIEIIDQTKLPGELDVVRVTTTEAAVDAIKRLAIRGAPALGAFGAYAVVVGLRQARREGRCETLADALAELERLRLAIGDARPTAVNLKWAVDRTVDAALAVSQRTTAPDGDAIDTLIDALLAEAHTICAEDEASCAEIGRLGARLLPDNPTVATHCNTGRLATAGIGTALAPVYTLAAAGQPVKVLAAETRPLLQGARLTAWELADANIDVTVVADGAMAGLLAQGAADAVIVGADRIAANGDTANKVGTLAHALAADATNVPFYVAAPCSTIDPRTPTGAHITIEQRDEDEVHHAAGGRRLTPAGVAAANPAFDVTPAALITAIVTDRGVLRPPYDQAIDAALKATGPPARSPNSQPNSQVSNDS